MENQSSATIPSSVRKAVYLLIAALALGLPRTMIEWPALYEQASRLPNGLKIMIGTQLFSFCLVGALLLLVYRRHNWARWVYAVLTVLGIPFSAYQLSGAMLSAPASSALGFAQLFLQVAGIYFLFRPEANAWFKPAARESGSPA
ncbi:MAG: hypothetical protein EOP11_00440 [Proteobacteria bacterium]|nr:MAG: hypothetical protein EOP11_00440 [Pseudomonadota bacterium]